MAVKHVKHFVLIESVISQITLTNGLDATCPLSTVCPFALCPIIYGRPSRSSKKLFSISRFEMHLQLGEARRRHNLMDQFEEASFTNKYYNLTSQATFKK